MDRNFSIDEILSAVDEIHNIKKKEKEIPLSPTVKKDFSEVPKHTLKLIEEAEDAK